MSKDFRQMDRYRSSQQQRDRREDQTRPNVGLGSVWRPTSFNLEGSGGGGEGTPGADGENGYLYAPARSGRGRADGETIRPQTVHGKPRKNNADNDDNKNNSIPPVCSMSHVRAYVQGTGRGVGIFFFFIDLGFYELTRG